MNEDYVVIVDRSAGNESVGEMWQETKVFGPDDTLFKVVQWAQRLQSAHNTSERAPTNFRITLTRAHKDSEGE